MKEIIRTTVVQLCKNANILYNYDLYEKLKSLFQNTKNNELKNKISYILENIKLAYETERPMCQDTGSVIVFLKVGTRLPVVNYNRVVNEAVKTAYIENYFRKSIVKNSLSNRENTSTNAPAQVYVEFDDSDEIKIDLMVKGAGSENMSSVKMFSPSASKEDIFEFIKEAVYIAGEKACPPVVLGVGIGGTMDGACILSKKAFFEQNESEFARDFMQYAHNEKILDVRVLSSASHIASLPVAVTVGCHCTRHSSCVIKNQEIVYINNKPEFEDFKIDYKAEEVFSDDIVKIKSLKPGENILLTGEIYTARDAAHKMLADLIESGQKLPIELKDKIIFYAGPCPEKPGEISGPIGPTTSYRMDKYAEMFYSHGLLASVGKGERSSEAQSIINKYGGKYFTAVGGISCLLAKCVKSSQIVAFDELGTEAVRRLYVKKFPITVSL